MLILEGDRFFESHWISTILESVFAIYIFLLGIPSLFAHIFMPEEFRELYTRRFKQIHYRKLQIFTVWVVLFIVFFANHLVKNLIVRYVNQEEVEKVLLSLNVITLILFISYFYFTISYLRELFFTNVGYTGLLLENIKKEIIVQKQVTPQIIYDLQTVAGGTRNPNSRQQVLQCVHQIIDSYLSNVKMDDSILEELVYKVLVEAITENSTFHNERDMRLIHTINDDIIVRNCTFVRPFNCRASIECLFQVGTICLHQKKNELLLECLASMIKAKGSYFYIRELCRLSLQYGYLVPTADKAIEYLEKYRNSANSSERDAFLLNSITFFAWLNLDNNIQAKRFVFTNLTPAVAQNEIDRHAFERILEHYYEENDFYTANAVAQMAEALFPAVGSITYN